MIFSTRSFPSIQSLFSEIMSEHEDIEEFGKWAFGEEYEKFTSLEEFLHSWNRLHGMDKMLDPAAQPIEDRDEMVALWRKYL